MIFSTHGIHPRERLSYWREVATRGYVEHDFTPHDGLSFGGKIEISTLPDLVMAKYMADGAEVRRSAQKAARSDSDDLLLALVFNGEIYVSQDGRDNVFRGGSFYLVDPLRPFDLTLRTYSESLVVKMPRAMIEARVGTTTDLTSRALSESAIGTLAMGFLQQLPRHAEALDDIAGLKVADQAMDLVALSLTAQQRTRGPALSSPRAVTLARLKATAERLLVEPGLKPERIAAEAGISVRYANTLLAEENTSLERYVNERRLERCLRALEDGSQSHRSIGQIAFKWGFSDLSHFSRRFKARYGLAPSDYRREIEQRWAAASPVAEVTRETPRPK